MWQPLAYINANKIALALLEVYSVRSTAVEKGVSIKTGNSFNSMG